MTTKKIKRTGRRLSHLEQLRAQLLYFSRKYLNNSLDNFIRDGYESMMDSFETIRQRGRELSLEPFRNGRFTADTVMLYHFRMHFYNRNETDLKDMEFRLKMCLKLLWLDWDEKSAKEMSWYIRNYFGSMQTFFMNFKKMLKRIDCRPDYKEIFITNKLSPALYPLAIRLCTRNVLNQVAQGPGKKQVSFLQLVGMLDRVVYKKGIGDTESELYPFYYDLKKMPIVKIGEWLTRYIKRKMKTMEPVKPSPVKTS